MEAAHGIDANADVFRLGRGESPITSEGPVSSQSCSDPFLYPIHTGLFGVWQRYRYPRLRTPPCFQAFSLSGACRTCSYVARARLHICGKAVAFYESVVLFWMLAARRRFVPAC